MGSEETEPESSSTPRLPLLSNPFSRGLMQSPETSGALTPPFYSSASIPFRWEEEPGKPRHCTILANKTVDFTLKSLEPPPRLLMDACFAKRVSPTTVLEGPYVGKSSRFQSSSFRIIRRERLGSFRSCCSPEKHQLGAMVLNDYKRGLFGSWRWGMRAFKVKREVVGGSSHVFPSFVDREADNEEEDDNTNGLAKNKRITRSGSFSALSHARSPFWVTIYEGLKQVVPWKGSKGKKASFAT
ncbi:hypothetical protein K2173_025455 [Erythroxylum novogranatense]|uniref:Uncharacterized protein n=1 Tax=Erythroxylum novogranatense TaxID=1862640 RepID=A0AAV8UDZ3_9ROSI|nr:hypothetical protein K2173_025455 [Erythroxylum novogranatense]